jgi:CBS domain-containing protein
MCVRYIMRRDILMYSTSSRQRIEDLIKTELVTLPEDSIVYDAVRTMKDRGISSILVRSVSSSEKNPLVSGIVTERDILYRVIGGNKGPYKTILRDVMSSPLVTIDEGASVTEAISLMRSLKIRRLLVVRREKTKEVQLGLVTLMSIIGNVPTESLDLAEIESPSPGKAIEKVVEIVCPYCESKFENKSDLSKHIDRIHVGSGLLEGDLRQR